MKLLWRTPLMADDKHVCSLLSYAYIICTHKHVDCWLRNMHSDHHHFMNVTNSLSLSLFIYFLKFNHSMWLKIRLMCKVRKMNNVGQNCQTCKYILAPAKKGTSPHFTTSHDSICSICLNWLFCYEALSRIFLYCTWLKMRKVIVEVTWLEIWNNSRNVETFFYI